MTHEYELADSTRESLIYEKEDLLAPLAPGMVPPPHSMVEGTDHIDYYQGKVTGATEAQREEVAERAAAAGTGAGEPDAGRTQTR